MHLRSFVTFFLLLSVTCWAQESISWKGISSFSKTDMVQVVEKTTKINGIGKRGVFIKGRTVVLEPYSISKYLVTQQLYQAVMADENDIFADCPSVFKDNPDQDEKQELRPVDYVNWFDVVYFCNKLSKLEGLEPIYDINILATNDNHITEATVKLKAKWHSLSGYRLPTEAEWEYAARGADINDSEIWNEKFSGGDNSNDVMWHYKNSNEKTHEVGLKQPNKLGIFDMSGNVKEWCFDAFGNVSKGVATNPIGVTSSPCYVQRGGSWSDNAKYCSVTRRENDKPFKLNKYYGFRLVRSSK